jgi:GNAT superfamily N-acetyltransferase
VSTASSLRTGVVRRSRDGREFAYRFVAPDDDVEAITDLLHRAYAPLAAAGMRFTATHQTSDVTARRMARGDTIVSVAAGSIVAIVTLARADRTSGSPFYDRPDVASFGQFAVQPHLQGAGIGSSLLTMVEELATERGVAQLALDTSEHATELIRFYAARGYGFVEHARWPDVNYRSVILAKALRDTQSDGRKT